jgi:hypothetical protein
MVSSSIARSMVRRQAKVHTLRAQFGLAQLA